MKTRLITIGTRMPAWVEQGVDEYCKRLPAEFALQLQEVPMVTRGKGADRARALRREGEGLLSRVGKNDHIVAMDVRGKSHSTEELARRIDSLRMDGRQLSLLVGGPDGLDGRCLQAADEKWSLSALTLPHPLVRIVIAEQMYRIWSLLNGHPYHRA